MTKQKRAEILDVAAELFMERGFQAVGIDAVIAASGVARMTVYRNFKSKDLHVNEVIADRAQKILADLNKCVASKRTTTTRVKAIFEWHADWFRSPDFHGCLFEKALTEYSSNTEVRKSALKYKADMLAIIRNILLVDYKPAMAEYLARCAAILIEGATNTMHAEHDASIADVAWNAMQTLINDAPIEG